ncbi:peptidoglycan editing factor PgeF [Spirosoma soli]|uniref:Purine nucleoside phosphorylase n=1 Tax=Spirosoma soli TaxID=1770529 RepID=A0ABW5M1R9_9BACT
MPTHSVDLKAPYRIPALFSRFSNLIVAESTRHGGVSPAPFASLNLGINTTDDAANVDENRRRFFEAIGASASQFASSHQVHGTDILYTTEPGRFEGYDALITDKPGLLIGVTVADCVPILIYDSKNQVVAAVHAGWRGTVGGIVAKTLARMQEQFGTRAKYCYAYIGTCIDEASFEVGSEVAEQFAPDFIRVDPYTQKTCANLKSANTRIFIDFGVPSAQIGISAFSTVLNNDDYFSYRAEGGKTGRMLAVVGIKG